jgi:serine/threonine protein kinase
MSSSSSNVVGVHYRVGKKIGEGSFGVIFEGTNLLNNQQVAIKFVRSYLLVVVLDTFSLTKYLRNPVRAMHLNYEMNTGHTRFLLDAVSQHPSSLQ